MSDFHVEPLHPDFGARITGVDLGAPLSEPDVESIREAIDTWSLLCFPGQGDDGRGAPRLHAPPRGAGGGARHAGQGPARWCTSAPSGKRHRRTAAPHGNAPPPNPLPDRQRDVAFGFLVPPRALLRIQSPTPTKCPEKAGGTHFVSMRSAYERLPGTCRRRSTPSTCCMTNVFSRSQVAPVDPNHAASLPPVAHRLVRTNPGNGRKGYYVGSHARSIVGWSGIESRRLIDDLLERATRPEDVYTHQWRAGRHGDLGQPLPAAPGRRVRRRPLAPADAPDPRRGGMPNARGVRRDEHTPASMRCSARTRAAPSWASSPAKTSTASLSPSR